VCRWSLVVGRGPWVVGRGSWVVGRGSWVVGRGRSSVVGRRRGRRSLVVGRGSWVVNEVFGRRSWVVWVVVVSRGRGSWVVGRKISLSFRLSFHSSLRLTRRRGAQLLPLLCTREWAARNSDLRSCTASRRVCGWAGWRTGLALALHARVGVGGAQLRLTLFSHSVAACTAAVRPRLGGVSPRLLCSLCIRGWPVRGSDLRSRTASRLVLHWCGASGGVAPSLFPLLATLGGARLRLASTTRPATICCLRRPLQTRAA